MDSTIYRRESGLAIDRQPDDWAIIHPPDDQKGIALDPTMSAVWSSAEGHTVTDVARSVHISTYLASCALAVLQHAGLLRDGPSDAASLSSDTKMDAAQSSVSALILHCHPQADLDACLDSLLRQRNPALTEITVIAADFARLEATGACVRQRGEMSWAHALIEQFAQTTGEAVLLLDSGIKLTKGTLSEMVRTLQLRKDIAAVAPRVMWERWQRFVVRVGDPSMASDSRCAPYAGHLDVGQFKRWRGVSSLHASAGLLRREALHSVRMSDGFSTPEQVTRDWSRQIRSRGYHILAALQAVAYGPWSQALACDATSPTMYRGLPALTVESIRGLYSHYATVTPLPLQGYVPVELPQYGSHAFEEGTEMARGDDGDLVPRLQFMAAEPTPIRALPGRAWQTLQQQGLMDTAREIRRYIRWRVGG